MLKKENIKAICSIDTFDNSLKLCKQDNIIKVQINDMGEYGVKVTGLVKGNFGFYHTSKLTLNPNYRNIIEGYDCNCYEIETIKGPCRHCMALALALAEDSDENFDFKLKPRENKNSVSNVINNNVNQNVNSDIRPEINPQMHQDIHVEIPGVTAGATAGGDLYSTRNIENRYVENIKNVENISGTANNYADNAPAGTALTQDGVTASGELTDNPADIYVNFPGDVHSGEVNAAAGVTNETVSEEENKPEEEKLPPRGMEIVFGNEKAKASDDEEEESKPLVWYPNDTTKVFHTNTGIIGTMGTGKTQFTKSLITQLYRQQKNNFNGNPLGILIFDYKGDYNNTKKDFVEATNAKVLKLHRLPFNPLSIFETKEYKPLLPVHTANTFKDTLARAFRLGPKQQTVLYTCMMQAYEKMGIFPNEPETWQRSAPTFEMVYDIYDKNESVVKNDSLAAVMQKINAFQLFEPKPYSTASLFDILDGVVVIDLSGYDPDLQSLIVAITLDQFYSQMHAAGSSATDGTLRQLTKFILVDEADNFMKEEFPSLKKIMKEGREFGVGTILSTQFLDHFVAGEDNYSKYILTWIVHNVADLKKNDVEFVFKTKANSEETNAIYQNIKGLDRFNSAVKIGNESVRYIKEKPFFELVKEN